MIYDTTMWLDTASANAMLHPFIGDNAVSVGSFVRINITRCSFLSKDSADTTIYTFIDTATNNAAVRVITGIYLGACLGGHALYIACFSEPAIICVEHDTEFNIISEYTGNAVS